MHSNDVARLGAGAAAIALTDRTREVHVFKGRYEAQYTLRTQNSMGDRVNLRPKTKRKTTSGRRPSTSRSAITPFG